MASLGNSHGFKHGHGANNKRTPTYLSWANMKSRCDHASCPRYADYGGRGIAYCERWRLFQNFLEDMGERPNGTTLDRIDVDGNYEPGNCRWASEQQQKRNTRRNVILEFGGRSMCVADWALEIGIRRQSLEKRLKNGWSVERALTTPLPPRHHHPRQQPS
jgi:hypothetical protein